MLIAQLSLDINRVVLNFVLNQLSSTFAVENFLSTNSATCIELTHMLDQIQPNAHFLLCAEHCKYHKLQ